MEQEPLNRIVDFEDDLLIIVTPDEELWDCYVSNLRVHSDLRHLSDLAILGELQIADKAKLAQYGVRHRSTSAEEEPRPRQRFGLRGH